MRWRIISNAARWRPVGLFPALILANLAAWYWAWDVFGGHPALMGTALLAWVFGLRHAMDADHIAAIDNVVRKLMRDGQRPVTVGFWFSLGHSSVVVLASTGVAVASAAMAGQLEAFKAVAGPIGACVSAGFLLLIAAINVSILRDTWRGFRHVARGGALDDTGLDPLLNGGGLLSRLCRPLFRAIGRSWHMFPLGFLFGLGFDTATEVGLLGIAASQTAQGLSAANVMIFPALFTAGMVLADTADSALMVGAYGWAFVRPLHKLWYNLTITALSVFVALFIGGMEILGLAANRLGLEGGVWSAVAVFRSSFDASSTSAKKGRSVVTCAGCFGSRPMNQNVESPTAAASC